MQTDDVKRDDRINSWFWIYRYYKRTGNEPLALHWKKRWQIAAGDIFDFPLLIAELAMQILFIRKFRVGVKSVLGDHQFKRIKRKMGIY